MKTQKKEKGAKNKIFTKEGASYLAEWGWYLLSGGILTLAGWFLFGLFVLFFGTAFCLYLVPLICGFIAQYAGVTYESNTIDLLLMLGLPSFFGCGFLFFGFLALFCRFYKWLFHRLFHGRLSPKRPERKEFFGI